ncbi:MAG: sulfotransferase family protein [Leptolyngbyaceae cyanobacterium SM1_4_3]|nr:sulfotransferase family protein [Leptolyngbyaceae cyanobacterium SM1_4_3]
MTIQVVGAGSGRTGTLSLKAALEELGFRKCYHMVELLQHPEHIQFWEQISTGQSVDWEFLFAGYEAIVDFPGNRYYLNLLQAYPNAKIILTIRDPESWYESMLNTVYQTNPTSLQKLMMALKLPFSTRSRQIVRIFQLADRVWQQDFQGKFEQKDFAIAIFNYHIEQVKQLIPAERLLIYEVKEGWEPLCRFLIGPFQRAKPFPHLNERANFGEFARRLIQGKF